MMETEYKAAEKVFNLKFCNLKTLKRCMKIKKYTKVGNLIFYIGLLVFVLGLSMNKDIGWSKYYPEHYTNYSMPIMIAGVGIVIITNFFRKKKKSNDEGNKINTTTEKHD